MRAGLPPKSTTICDSSTPAPASSQLLSDLAAHFGFDLDKPFKQLPARVRTVIWRAAEARPSPLATQTTSAGGASDGIRSKA